MLAINTEIFFSLYKKRTSYLTYNRFVSIVPYQLILTIN